MARTRFWHAPVKALIQHKGVWTKEVYTKYPCKLRYPPSGRPLSISVNLCNILVCHPIQVEIFKGQIFLMRILPTLLILQELQALIYAAYHDNAPELALKNAVDKNIFLRELLQFFPVVHIRKLRHSRSPHRLPSVNKIYPAYRSPFLLVLDAIKYGHVCWSGCITIGTNIWRRPKTT